MGKIFCLMGKSSSGKDTIFKKLMGDSQLGLIPILPYTTRPKRNDETNGVEYYFINEEILQSYEQKGKVIEKRAYHTVNGIWHYCTIDDGQIDLHKGNYLIIATLEAYKNLQNYFGKEHVVPFYIEVDDGLRLERALKRERQQKNPNYDELCRRFLADNIDFSDEQLKANTIDKFYNNSDLEQCIQNIKKDMLQHINSI